MAENEAAVIQEQQQQPKKERKVILTDEMLSAIVKQAAEAAIAAYKAEQAKKSAAIRDKRYNSAKSLLRSYRALRDYVQNTIFDVSQVAYDSEILEAVGMLREAREIEVIRDRLEFTEVVIENVNNALASYNAWCGKSQKPEVQRRWRVLEKMYLSEDEKTAQEIADEEYISLRQVYDDIDKAAQDLSKRLFGIDETIFNDK